MREKGYTPDLVLDIGAEKGTWTQQMTGIYPSAQYMLFEVIPYQELDAFRAGNASVFNTLLFDSETEVDWFEMRNTGDSIFKERGHAFQNCAPVKRMTTTLERELCGTDLSRFNNILIKIDCQGAEVPILRGAGAEILRRTDFIILEVPLFGQYNEGVPSFLEHVQYMDSIGFIPFDIADCHYIHGFNRQVDMIFISKTHPFNTQTEYH